MMEKRLKMIITLGIVILLLTMIIIGGTILSNMRDAGADVGVIELTIDGNYANITVEVDIEPDVNEDDVILDLETDDSNIPLTYENDKIKGTLTENELTSVLEHNYVNISGEVDTKVLGIINVNKDIRKEVNISFIHELSSSLTIEDIEWEFAIIYFIINFEFVANVTTDFQINITDTDAKVTSPGGVFNAKVLELNYRTGNIGNARIRLPLPGTLGLVSLNNREIMVETWGILVTVDIPFFSG